MKRFLNKSKLPKSILPVIGAMALSFNSFGQWATDGSLPTSNVTTGGQVGINASPSTNTMLSVTAKQQGTTYPYSAAFFKNLHTSIEFLQYEDLGARGNIKFNYLRIRGGGNSGDMLKMDYSGDTYFKGNITTDGSLNANNSLTVNNVNAFNTLNGTTNFGGFVKFGQSVQVDGADICLGRNDDRSNPKSSDPKDTRWANRALVHWNSDRLVVNFNGDFEGGTFVENKLTIGAVGIRDKVQNAHDDAMLAVEGKIAAKTIVVSASIWADYVFEKNYKLKSLNEVENFIIENKHLPEVPSEKEVMEKGISLGEMDAVLLKKIEELTLYVIDLNKKVEDLKKENEILRTK